MVLAGRGEATCPRLPAVLALSHTHTHTIAVVPVCSIHAATGLGWGQSLLEQDKPEGGMGEGLVGSGGQRQEVGVWRVGSSSGLEPNPRLGPELPTASYLIPR